uniref:Uncharacterized protein n=2 Tax=Odontella aurita TaxID=265563 RepID=A0A7S4M8H8_9STRA|mmetsp:Transcript_14458/g.42372  ORF Transcript_14458/g.42372 Transcript_14458/m.42372 type:complete len:194 (+) Transcript_14458:176-757(+)
MKMRAAFILAIHVAALPFRVAGFASLSPLAKMSWQGGQSRLSKINDAEGVMAMSRKMTDPPGGGKVGAGLWKRMDTLHSAGLRPYTCTTSSQCTEKRAQKKAYGAFSVGFFGHSGLLLLSIILVNVIKGLLFPPTDADEPKPAGMMNRCPWPFIFFHDLQQGFKDSPTWVVVVWVALWRCLKCYRSSANTVGL